MYKFNNLTNSVIDGNLYQLGEHALTSDTLPKLETFTKY
jgi:hypothetical protein